MEEIQKTTVLSHHIRRKTPWCCHPSQIGHGGYKNSATTTIRHERHYSTKLD